MTDPKSGLKPAVALLGLKKAKPSRRAAIHEAGHALAHWWNGQIIECAEVRTKAEMRAGPYIDRRGRESGGIEGVVEASSFISSPELTLQCGTGMDNPLFPEMVARDLIHACSGPVAEAIHRKAGLFGVLWTVGAGDLVNIRALLALLPDDQRAAAERQAIARCRVLVRRYWPAVEALADLLQERGRVDGEELESLLLAVSGESPTWRGNPLSDLDKRGARHA